MKTKVLLLGAVITAFACTSPAAESLLSPRAAGNQINRVPGTASQPGPAVAAVSTALPRARDNQVKPVTGLNNEVNPATLCRRLMAGSPKAIQACAANPLAPMPCCGGTAVK